MPLSSVGAIPCRGTCPADTDLLLKVVAAVAGLALCGVLQRAIDEGVIGDYHLKAVQHSSDASPTGRRRSGARSNQLGNTVYDVLRPLAIFCRARRRRPALCWPATTGRQLTTPITTQNRSKATCDFYSSFVALYANCQYQQGHLEARG